MKRWTTALLVFSLVGAVMSGVLYERGRRSHRTISPGRFVATSHIGTLAGTGSPPMMANIEESGGKIRVRVREQETSGAGLKIGIDAGAEFDLEPKWFVAFDENDMLHYGIYPKWVSRIDRTPAGFSVRGLSAQDREKAFAEVAKTLGW
jgi:hypothetical protein